MRTATISPPPNAEILANLYVQLSRMEESGMSQVQAFSNLSATDQTLAKPLHMTLQYLKSGHSIAESTYRTGLLGDMDRELIKAGESSGKLGDIYRQLAVYYADKARRLRKIKSRLFLPLTILFLALLIQPVPDLFAGKISVLDYILASFGSFIYLLLVLYSIWRLPYWLCEGQLRFLGLRQLVYSLQLSLPVISPWVIRRQIREFLLVLGLMQEAGLPMLDAIPKAANSIKNALLSAQLHTTVVDIQAGYSVSEAFAQLSEFSPTAIQLISSGEHSGKLAETLLHFAKLEAEAISMQEEMLAEWIPRMIYISIAMYMGYSIVASYMSYFANLNQTISNL